MDLRKKLNNSYKADKEQKIKKAEWERVESRKPEEPPASAASPKNVKTDATYKDEYQNRSPSGPFTPAQNVHTVSSPEFVRFDAPRTSLKAVVQGHTNRGYRKAAKLMLLLGRDDAAKVLEHFSEDEVEKILAEVASTRKVEEVEAKSLLQEFGLIKTTMPLLKGGKTVARELLVKAFGEQTGEDMFKRIIPYEGEKPFQFLFDLDPQQIFILLKKEPVPVVAMVLANLPAKLSGRALKYFNPPERKDIVKRIGRLEKVDPDVITNTEELLKERYRTQGRIVADEIDGKGRLAQILKHMPASSEDMILESIEETDPQLSNDLKDKVYTVEMAYQLPKRDLSKVLRDFSDEDLAVLAFCRDREYTRFLLDHVSSRRRSLVLQEAEYNGLPSSKEKDRVSRDFVDMILELREKGKISFKEEYI